MIKQAGIGLVSASLMLAGCDSGSNNSSSSSSLTYNGPTAPVAISESNANTVAGFAASESTSTETQNNLVIAGVSASPSESGTEPTSLTILGRLEKYTDIAQAADVSGTTTLTGVTTTDTKACSGGGTVTINLNYSDPTLSQTYSGDSYSFSYANCVETDPDTGITEQLNGTVSGLHNNTYSFNADAYDMSISISLANFKVTNLANGDYSWLDGTLQYNLSRTALSDVITSSLSGSAMVAETNTAGITEQVNLTNFSFGRTWNISTLQSSFDSNFTVASAEIGGSITVLTVNPFVVDFYGSANPISGQLIVTGADNAKVRLTAQPDATNAYLEYDIAPIDDVYETNATIPWADL